MKKAGRICDAPEPAFGDGSESNALSCTRLWMPERESKHTRSFLRD